VHNSRLTIILPYKLDTTNDLLTSRAGLLAIAQLMDSLSLAERIDQHFPQPKSNRGYKPSEFIKTLILMHHEGSFHLDDIRHIQDDEALRTVLDLNKLPQATTLGDWLRRMGNQPQIQDAWVKVNRALLQSALHRCKKVTLDIDATVVLPIKRMRSGHTTRTKALCQWWGILRKLVRLWPWISVKVMYHHRAMTLRWRLYAIAAKVVRTGRQLFVKMQAKHRILLERVLMALKEFEPPPI